MAKQSYQDLTLKFAALEDCVNFLMNNIQMRGFIPNGLSKVDGSPDGKYLYGTAGEFFRLAVQEGLKAEPGPVPAEDTPAAIGAELNG